MNYAMKEITNSVKILSGNIPFEERGLYFQFIQIDKFDYISLKFNTVHSEYT